MIRDAIVSMQLKPGQRLVERELVAWSGVSRATIRESLRQLAAEGLVKTIPQRGAVVAVPTPAEAEEIYEVRALLEGLLGRQFVERATAAQRNMLRASFEALQRTAEEDAGDTSAMLQAKKAFYEVLFRGAGNSTVESVLTALQARITVLRATSMSRPGRSQSAVAEIRMIVDAVEGGDAAAAEAACRAHVLSARRNALDALAAGQESKEGSA